MKSVVTDLRYLKLAELYEDAYERFIIDVALRTIKDDEVRSQLLRLAGKGGAEDHHQRIVQQMERLNGMLSKEDDWSVTRAAILDVIEVERAARDFYLGAVDKLHDPSIVKLFRENAREEQRHVEIAEDILARADGAPVRRASKPAASEELSFLTENEPLLREGVIDFGPPHKPKQARPPPPPAD